MKTPIRLVRGPWTLALLVGAVWTFNGGNAAQADTSSNSAATGLAIPATGGDAAANALASASVEPSTGVLTASYPFALATARGGVQPTLGLSYLSSGGVREAGFRWGLDLPYIERRSPSGNRGA